MNERIDIERCRKLIRAARFHNVSADEVRKLTPGWDSAAFEVDRVWIFRAGYARRLGRDFSARQAFYRSLVPAYALQAGRYLDRPDLVREGLDGVGALLVGGEESAL